MTQDSIILTAGLAFIGGTVMWGKDITSRLAVAETVIQKIDKLVDLLLEERVGTFREKLPPPIRPPAPERRYPFEFENRG